jgi:hypothetical protein
VKRGRVVAFAGVVAIAAAAWASPASAATLIGDYQLQGSRASAVPGPALGDIAGGNAFATENVLGATRQVLTFPLGSGVQMIPSVGSGDVAYSAVTTFRLDAVDGYRRILDTSNGTSDVGFYDSSGRPAYGTFGDNVVFANGVYATVAITSLPSPARTKFYVNGSLQLNTADAEPVVADTLNFFKDNVSGSTPGEESGGAVSCVRVYSGALSDDEVAGIGASPTCGTVTPSPTPKRKCKKHKRKRRAADAKKKKCKKKKKR